MLCIETNAVLKDLVYTFLSILAPDISIYLIQNTRSPSGIEKHQFLKTIRMQATKTNAQFFQFKERYPIRIATGKNFKRGLVVQGG